MDRSERIRNKKQGIRFSKKQFIENTRTEQSCVS